MRIHMFFLVLFSSTAAAQHYAARVSVDSPEDVIALHRAGAAIDDAKVRTHVASDGTVRYKARYNPENGFVTIVGDRNTLDDLERSGFAVRIMHEVDTDRPPVFSVKTSLDTIPYQFGWPRSIYNGNSLYENSPTVADVNKDGQLNVSVTNAWGSYQPPNPPYVITWRRNGAYLPGFPVPLEPGQFQSSADAGISAIGDIYGDDKLETVCGDENGYLYAFNFDGSRLTGFPVNFGASVGVFTPALADIDGDGKCEIAVISHNWDSPFGNAFLHLFKVTSTGPVEMPGFPVNLQRGAENSPAIGDLDGDGSFEIVVATGGITADPIARIIAYTSSGQVVPGFPFLVGSSSAGNSPTLYDITGDGKLEILMRVRPDSTMVNGIYAIDFLGRVVPGFPFPITFGNPVACVAVGDMTGDGIPELAYGGVEAVDSGKVWVYNLAGELLPGFPARVFRTWVDGSVAIADVDGDGFGDVVCGTNGVSNKPGLIRAFNRLGQEVEGFPLSPGNPILNSFETHPTLVDIDGDGDTEIFAGRLDKFVYGWDTPGLFDTTRVWTTFKGNAARTGGQLRSPFAVSVSEGREVPAEFRLYQNYPNPFNPNTAIRFEIGIWGSVSLRVFDLLGRGVETLVEGELSAGEYTAVWDASGFASGVYIARLEAGGRVMTMKLTLLR